MLQARAHLLNVGLMAPAKDVSAVQINHMLGDVAGAHAGAGKVSEQDRTDIPRFLNRRVCARQDPMLLKLRLMFAAHCLSSPHDV